MSDLDWLDWHDAYDQPGSSLHRRLLAVRRHIGSALDGCGAGPIRLVSLCAGQGRDVLPVLAGHPRRDDVTALLVELDPRNVRVARDTAREAGLAGVEVVEGDAADTDLYRGAVPADVVVACGIFGNIVAAEIKSTIFDLRSFCAEGATVIWTRGRWEPDITPAMCDWFEQAGFTLVTLVPPPGPADFGTGVHRYPGPPRPLEPGRRMFHFVGYDVLGRTLPGSPGLSRRKPDVADLGERGGVEHGGGVPAGPGAAGGQLEGGQGVLEPGAGGDPPGERAGG